MAAKKKVNPRTKFLTCRTSPIEEIELMERAKLDGFTNKKDFSRWIRYKLGLKEDNE